MVQATLIFIVDIALALISDRITLVDAGRQLRLRWRRRRIEDCAQQGDRREAGDFAEFKNSHCQLLRLQNNEPWMRRSFNGGIPPYAGLMATLTFRLNRRARHCRGVACGLDFQCHGVDKTMSKYKILSGIALMGFAPAFADQSDFYAELGYARYGIDVSEQDFDPGAIQARAGYMIWPQIGIEVEAAAGAHKSSLSSGDTRLSVKIDQALAGYLVGRWPVGERIDLVGRAGYQKLDVSVTGEQTDHPTERRR